MTIKYLDAKRIRGSSTGGASDALGTAVNGTNDGTSTNASTPINGQTSVEFDNNEYINSGGIEYFSSNEYDLLLYDLL